MGLCKGGAKPRAKWVGLGNDAWRERVLFERGLWTIRRRETTSGIRPTLGGQGGFHLFIVDVYTVALARATDL